MTNRHVCRWVCRWVLCSALVAVAYPHFTRAEDAPMPDDVYPASQPAGVVDGLPSTDVSVASDASIFMPPQVVIPGESSLSPREATPSLEAILTSDTPSLVTTLPSQVALVSSMEAVPAPNQLAYGEVQPAPVPSELPPVAPSAQPNIPTEQQKLGEAPEDYSHQFLRQESVLLRPGDWQLDIGINYTVFDHNYTNLAVGGSEESPSVVPVDSRFTSRLLLMPLDFRYGFLDRLQLFANVPFGWSNTENAFFGFDEFSNKGGIGDVTGGLSYLVCKGRGQSYQPDVIATLACTAPTADVSPLQGILEPPNTLLGQGFWFGSWNVLFVHTIDPVIIFYGFGSRHALMREYHGYDVRYGDQYMYRGGMGFAVNERVTLSASITGSYITDPRLDGQRIAGLAMEPVSMRFGATIARPACLRYWDPFVEIGLTDDAPNSRVGMTFTY